MSPPPAARTTGVRPVPVLADVARAARPLVLAHEQVLPVLPALSGLVSGQASGGALARGRMVRVDGVAASSLALALVAGPSAAGSWTAVVGCPDLGLAAAAEAGVALERLALVVEPPPGDWATVVAAFIGAVDVVVVGPSHRVRTGDARRLAARARERGTVLVHLAAAGPRAGAGAGGAGAIEADLRLTGVEAHWQGLGHGHGHLQARRLVVEATGRRRAARPHRQELWLPDTHGAVTAVTASSASSSSASSSSSYAGADADRLVDRPDRWRRVG
jgi:hypothetical protein